MIQNMKSKSIVMAFAALAAMATPSQAGGYRDDRGAEIAQGVMNIIAGAIASRRRDRVYVEPYPVPVPAYPPLSDPYYYDPYAAYQYGNDPYGTYYRPGPDLPLTYGHSRFKRPYVERYDPGYRYRGHGGYKYDQKFDPRYRD